jgi:protein-S-isoprenylcysteine O-methyltransferase Ste14
MMNHSFSDMLAISALLLWPAVPLFWIPVHCAPRLFRSLGFWTYALPVITWLPLAIVAYGLRDVLLHERIELPIAVQGIGALFLASGAVLQAWTLILLTFRGIVGMPEVTTVSGKLVSAGPFRVVRHPTYLSHTLMLSGISLITGVAAIGAVAVIDALVVNLVVIPLEERELLHRFGPEYEAYRKKVSSRFFPHHRSR